jgi:hypothetical protein
VRWYTSAARWSSPWNRTFENSVPAVMPG